MTAKSSLFYAFIFNTVCLAIVSFAIKAKSADGNNTLHFVRELPGLTMTRDVQWVKDLWERWNISANEKLVSDTEKIEVARWWQKDYLFLRITQRYGNDYQYIVFRKGEDKKTYLGEMKFSSQKTFPPESSMVTINGDDLLVVRSSAMSGTGVALYVDGWWHLGKEEVNKVLRVPVRGHVIGWGTGFARKFSSEVRFHRRKQKPVTVEYQMTAGYWAKADTPRTTVPLLEKELTARWRWDSEEHEFILRENHSNATPQEMMDIYMQSTKGFLNENLSELKTMESTVRSRGWIRKLMEASDEPYHRKALREILDAGTQSEAD